VPLKDLTPGTIRATASEIMIVLAVQFPMSDDGNVTMMIQ